MTRNWNLVTTYTAYGKLTQLLNNSEMRKCVCWGGSGNKARKWWANP